MSSQMQNERWVIEEANHFNPAFCGALIYEFIRAYEKLKHHPVSFALLFCALPIALHPATRQRLPLKTTTQMFSWLEQNQDLKVGFGERARNLAPYIKEAARYAASRNAICFESTGMLVLGAKRASFTKGVLAETTSEVRAIVAAVRMVAKWFASSGDAATILASWGVRV